MIYLPSPSGLIIIDPSFWVIHSIVIPTHPWFELALEILDQHFWLIPNFVPTRRSVFGTTSFSQSISDGIRYEIPYPELEIFTSPTPLVFIALLPNSVLVFRPILFVLLLYVFPVLSFALFFCGTHFFPMSLLISLLDCFYFVRVFICPLLVLLLTTFLTQAKGFSGRTSEVEEVGGFRPFKTTTILSLAFAYLHRSKSSRWSAGWRRRWRRASFSSSETTRRSTQSPTQTTRW